MRINATEEIVYTLVDSERKKVAAFTDAGIVSYGDYYKNVKKYERLLRSIFHREPIKVGIIMEDCPEFVFLFWASLKIGIIPILINNKFNLNTIKTCIDSIELKYLILKHADIGKFIRYKYSFTELALYENSCFIKINGIEQERLDIKGENIAFGIFTSGSTGVPKCVLHNHKSIIQCVELYYKKMLKVTSDDVVYSVSKMMHTYGLGNTVFQSAGVRATSIISADDTIESIIDNIKRYRPTIFFAVPTVYQDLLKMHKTYSVDLSSIKMFFSAGEHLSLQLSQAFYKKFGGRILDGMGNTEYLTTFITNTQEQYKEGSCGKCIPGFTPKIVGLNNREVACGETGRLFIKGTIHFSGYHLDEKIYSSQDYFDTHNLCSIDADGFIWFKGRSNDFFKVKGKWVNPLEIEEILGQMDEIDDSLVVLDNSSGLNKIILYVKLKKGISENSSEEYFIKKIKIFLKKRLEHYKCPSDLKVVEEIPLGFTGKKKRTVI